MPITINQIISEVQSDIGDLAEERIQRGEYVDLLNNVAQDVAESTEIFMDRYQTIPNNIFTDWSAGQTYSADSIVLYTGAYYFCLISHTSTVWANDSLYWQIIPAWAVGTAYAINDMVYTVGPIFYRCMFAHTATNADTPPFYDYWVLVTGGFNGVYNFRLPYTYSTNDFAPYRIVKVMRGKYYDTSWVWTACEEFSKQAIGITVAGERSFKINHTQLGAKHYATHFVNSDLSVDGSINFIFGAEFESGEAVTVDFISSKPFRRNPFTHWDVTGANPISIPDFLHNSFRYGLLAQVQERLFNIGDESQLNRLRVTQDKYNNLLLSASSYAKLFKDNRSGIAVQPMNWLGEE